MSFWLKSYRTSPPFSPPPGKAAIDVVGAQSGKSTGSMLQQALLILRCARLSAGQQPLSERREGSTLIEHGTKHTLLERLWLVCPCPLPHSLHTAAPTASGASPGYCTQQRTHTQPRLTHGPRPFPLQRWDPGRHPACADRDVHVHADPVEAGGVGAGYVQGSETDGLLLLNLF